MALGSTISKWAPVPSLGQMLSYLLADGEFTM